MLGSGVTVSLLKALLSRSMRRNSSASIVSWESIAAYAKGKKSLPSRSQGSTPRKDRTTAGSSNESEMSDLEFAMQLSLAEEQSRKDAEDAFPPLSPAAGSKGKGRMW